MDMTQIFFSRKDKHDNFEVFINESVSSKANTEALKSGGWQKNYGFLLKLLLCDNHTPRSSNPPPCAYQTRAAVLRDRFSSPALIPAVDYKLYPILCQLTFVPYTLHL